MTDSMARALRSGKMEVTTRGNLSLERKMEREGKFGTMGQSSLGNGKQT